MKFKVSKESETGKRLLQIIELMRVANTAQRALAKEIGAKQWRGDNWAVCGGMSAVIFPKDFIVNIKTWKNVNGSKVEWMPRLNTTEGKALKAKIDLLPRLENRHLNAAIGWKEHWKRIGINGVNTSLDVIGLSVQDEWKVKVPADCEEITVTEYENIFKSKI